MFRLLVPWLLFTSFSSAFAEEIPLTSCDGLPVVEVSVSSAKFSFLLDTAATSILNAKSFAHGSVRKLSVTSWSGTLETKGQKITLAELVIGEHHLRNLTLSAIDLSAIGRACGRQLDGILGIDLLRRLGAVVDLNDHAAPRLLLNARLESP